jgi:hypothetical protein
MITGLQIATPSLSAEKQKKKKTKKKGVEMYHERSNEDKTENHGDTTIIFNTASSRLRQNQRTVLNYVQIEFVI